MVVNPRKMRNGPAVPYSLTHPGAYATGIATTEPRYVEFTPDACDVVLSVMAELADAHEGWVNFEPSVHEEDVPAAGSAFSLFSSRGPAVPLGTWTPAAPPRRGRARADPAMVGLQHGAGSKVKALLAGREHPVPDGWVVTQDHPRKGLVLAVPPDTGPGEVGAWLVGAAATLSAVPLTGWRAAVYRPR